MSQFPADPSNAPLDREADPFDELARLINGEGAPAVAPVPGPVGSPQAAPSNDLDIQAAMEGRAPSASPAGEALPPMPVFDPSAAIAGPAVAADPSSAVRSAPAVGHGVHQVPTRGPLAQVSRGVVNPADSPLDAVFDLSALRAAFQRPNAQGAASEPIPASEPILASELILASEPVAEALREAPAASEPAPADAEPVFERASAPRQAVFSPPPVAAFPETEQAEIVTPPAAFAPAPAAVPADEEPVLVAEMEAILAAEAALAEPRLPEASFEIDLESELQAALMSDLANVAEATVPAAAPAAPIAAPSIAPTIAPEPVALGEEARSYPTSRNGSRRAMAMAAAFVIMGGGAAAGWTLLGDGPAAEAPVILANAGPAKVKPADAGGAAIPNRDTALFKEDTRPHQDALRSGAEKPVEVALAPRPVKVKTQLKRALPPTARKVRTVVVKPDGTIVSGEEIVGSVEPRVAKPIATKQAPAAATVKAKPIEPVRTAEATPATAAPIWGTEDVASKAADPAEPAPKAVVANASAKPAAPKSAATRPAAAEKAPAPKLASKAKAGGYVVQISSRRSAEAALRAFDKLKRRYKGVLGGREADYQRTEIDGKGTFYRVRVLASSKSDARSLCGSLKRAGGSCFVTR